MARKISRRVIATHIADELIKGTSQKKLTKQLAAYLIENRRTNELNLMVRDIQYYLSEKGYILGTVTTAHELGATTKKAIEAFAKKNTGAKHIELDSIVDESVLGGFKLDLPNKEIDTTIARQLTILKTKYKKA